jgi:hypothetical protein
MEQNRETDHRMWSESALFSHSETHCTSHALLTGFCLWLFQERPCDVRGHSETCPELIGAGMIQGAQALLHLSVIGILWVYAILLTWCKVFLHGSLEHNCYWELSNEICRIVGKPKIHNNSLLVNQNTLSVISVSLCSCHLHLCLPSGLFLPESATQTLALVI